MKKLTRDILDYLKERKWNDLAPGDIAKSISIEAAELLEIFQWSSPSLKEFKKDAEKIAVVKGELADVFIYCIELAGLLDLDAEELIREKLKKVSEKYPAHLFAQVKGGSKSLDLYWKIKSADRSKKARESQA